MERYGGFTQQAIIAQWLEHWSRKPGVMVRYGGFTQQAIIAQWLEHWSRKPGVVSSTLTDGLCFGWNTV
ncbi:hypothetical protein CDAR_612041 [Caerostris darwini]|uniref:Uncharacterized protein n=1 Tax=Caerostris darwini TaxID=1538125 RepID=A0AAV4MSR2_9ARAC|nr:hypothetical protein CDAR_612041 [Caerostris darwini]